MKKIFVVTNVKNESDVIESFCRYNVTYCDGMLIYENNRSTDNTRKIIQELINEGLPIFFADDVQVVRYVAAKNAIAKLAFEEYGADLVIPLDADEFLTNLDGDNPRESLEALDDSIEHHLQWRTYVYEDEPDISLGFLPNNFTHYRNPALDINKKAVLSKRLFTEKRAEFTPGAHYLVYPEEHYNTVPVEMHPKLKLSHFPLRSKAQLMNKVVPNWICKWRETFPEREGHGLQLGAIWDELRDTGEISQELIVKHSLEYGVEDYNLANILPEVGDNKTIEGKMDTAYCSDKLKLKYTDYKEASMTFIRATLTESELTFAALPKREEDTIKLYEKAQSDINDLRQRIGELTWKCNELTDGNERLKRDISEIYSSKKWKIGNKVSRMLRFFIPGGRG